MIAYRNAKMYVVCDTCFEAKEELLPGADWKEKEAAAAQFSDPIFCTELCRDNYKPPVDRTVPEPEPTPPEELDEVDEDGTPVIPLRGAWCGTPKMLAHHQREQQERGW